MKKALFTLPIIALLLLAQTGGNIQWTQIASGSRHGSGSKGQSSDGTGTSGHCAQFDSAGNVTDSGGVCGTGSGNLSGTPTNHGVAIGSTGQNVNFASPDTTTTHALFATATDPAFRAIAAGDIPAALSSTTSVNGTTIPSSATLTQTIGSGTASLGTSSISASTCATVVSVSATGVLTTDNISADFNADPTSTTGYQAGAMLTIVKYPTADHVNFKVCNNTASTITPSAVTLNWRVLR